MTKQNIRYVLWAALALVGLVLYHHWQIEILPKEKPKQTQEKYQDIPNLSAKTKTNGDIPNINPALDTEAPKSLLESLSAKRQVQVSTDVLELTIDTEGGDIVHLALPAYGEDRADPKSHYVLLDESQKRFYIAQSGLVGEEGPDIYGVGRGNYTVESHHVALSEGQNELVVDLKTRTKTGVEVIKRFSFKRGSYLIGVEYLIDNQGKSDFKAHSYGRLKRKPEESKSNGFLGMGIQTFTGVALYTPETPYKKFSFAEVEKKPFDKAVQGGWAAMIEHYFLGAWIPDPNTLNTYQTSKLEGGTVGVGFVTPAVVVKAGEKGSVKASLYTGPEDTDYLANLSKGLDLTVDYGIFWPICKPIFWLLSILYSWVGNWGWAIILTTIVIKALFYNLSARSYRSMGAMRKLQPKMQALKERFGNDKQQYSQAIMALYKQEKINPLGGCLPVLVQIPVFIALYYVLLNSVELRMAPFALWITDLSAKDPYYVLPVLMGLSMFVQQKLSPAPPDPVQAKVMMLMPIFFTILFASFPAGLVLYWFVNNVLSILQQWYITRRMELVPSHGGK
jgi:YidC/Oxa1 family membrane protein insertase